MTTSDFLFDPFASRILDAYILNYINFLRASPDIVERLRQRRGEFEMVPIPKTLLENIQISQEFGRSEFGGFDVLDQFWGLDQSGIFGQPPRASVRRAEIRSRDNDLEKAKHHSILIDLLRSFGQGLENGDLEQINGLVSENYQDYSNRTKNKLMEDVQQLLSQTSSRRLILVHVEEMQIVEGRIAADVTGAWEAEIVGKDGNEMKSEFFTLEFLFEQNERDLFQISSIKFR